MELLNVLEDCSGIFPQVIIPFYNGFDWTGRDYPYFKKNSETLSLKISTSIIWMEFERFPKNAKSASECH